MYSVRGGSATGSTRYLSLPDRVDDTAGGAESGVGKRRVGTGRPEYRRRSQSKAKEEEQSASRDASVPPDVPEWKNARTAFARVELTPSYFA